MHTRNAPSALLLAGALLAVALPGQAQNPPPRPGAPMMPGRPGPGGPMGGPGGQMGRGGRGGGGRGMSLASIPVSVMDMIAPLKADQKAKITAIEDKARNDTKTMDWQARGPVMSKAADDVKAVLTPVQLGTIEKELPTLGLVSRVIPVGVMGDLKLTKSQMSKITGVADAAAPQMQGLRGPERQAKMDQLNIKGQIEGVLTAPQKATIAKYEAAHPRRQGGPGGFGGPGGPGMGGPGGPAMGGRPGAFPGGPKRG